MRESHCLSTEHKAKLSAKAVAQHARNRGFEIPEHLRELYHTLSRQGIRPPELWYRLGIGPPKSPTTEPVSSNR